MKFMEGEMLRIMQLGGGSSRDISDIFKKLYADKSIDLDKNLEIMYNFIMSQANSIYYDRKVEYVNLVD